MELEDIILKQGDVIFFKDSSGFIVLNGGVLASKYNNVSTIKREGKLIYVDKSSNGCCEDCGAYIWGTKQGHYMVHNDLWATVGKSNDCFCMDCFEKRLGRKLEVKDFNLIVPINYLNKYIVDNYYTKILSTEEIDTLYKMSNIWDKLEKLNKERFKGE